MESDETTPEIPAPKRRHGGNGKKLHASGREKPSAQNTSAGRHARNEKTRSGKNGSGKNGSGVGDLNTHLNQSHLNKLLKAMSAAGNGDSGGLTRPHPGSPWICASVALTPASLRCAVSIHTTLPDDPRALYMGGTALSRLGEAKRAKDWAAQALAISPGDATVLYNVACIYSTSGESDEAISLLERAVAAGFGHWKWIENDSDFDPIRNNPRYEALLAKKEK